MRIAMIGSRGLGSNYGGIERVLDELCPNLAALGHEIDVFSRSDVDPTEFSGIRAVPIASFGGKHLDNLSRSFLSLCRAFGRYDVVHFHAIGPGILSALTFLGGQRSVVTVHALDHKRDKWNALARLCLGMAERTVTSAAQQVTVVSETLRLYFQERYDIDTWLIPNGSPVKAPMPCGALSRQHGLTPGRYLLFASRLTPEKGCHDLIETFNTLVRCNAIAPDLKLVVAGGSGSADYIAALKQQAVPERVRFVGHLAGDDLAEIFSNAYAFILPSYIEGMSMALLEAIAYGLPVLVSDIPENRSVAGRCDCYFRPRDLEDMGLAISALVSSPQKAQRISDDLRRVGRPGWDQVARSYDRLYRTATQPSLLPPEAIDMHA